MWGRKRQSAVRARPEGPEPQRLRDALRQARIDSAERTGVVVDLHDAEVARLELLNDVLEPLFAEIPAEIDLFERGLSRGENPRLWLDAIAHIAMTRDRRAYRLVQDTRYGRKVLAEAANIPEMAEAVTKYLTQRMVERERALAGRGTSFDDWKLARRWDRRHAIGTFIIGMLAGMGILIAAAILSAPPL